MKTRLSLISRSGWSRRTRIAVVALAALLPLSVVAQQGAAPQAQKSLLSGGSATAIPFTGPGWQDKVLQYEGYVMPPPELAAAVLAPREMNITLANPSPDRKWFLDEIGDGPVPMTIFGKPFDELGGVFIDFKANRLRSVTLRNTIGLQLISAADGSRKSLATPANTRVTNARWTQDGTGVMYMTLGDDSSQVWITDIATNKPRQITKTSLLTTFVTNYEIINNGKSLVAVFPPDGRSARPLPPPIPSGPEVSLALDGNKNRVRTYPSLMKTPYDLQLLEWHATGQIGIVDIATGAVTKFGKPAMITGIDMSPDGKYARVTRMTKPFSYLVPVSSFGSIEEVWDASGTALAKITERQLNLGAGQGANPDPPDPTQPPAQAPAAGGGRGGPGGAVNGKRELMWREDGQGFNYLQLEPPPPGTNTGTAGRGGRAGGNAAGGTGAGVTDPAQAGDAAQAPGGRGAQANQPPRKDRLMQWMPPFSETSTKLIYENPTQMNNVRFSQDGSIMFFTENNSTVAMFVNDMTTKYTISRGGGGGGQGRGAGGGGAGRGGPGAGGDTNAGTLMSAQGYVSPKSIGGGVPVMVSADGTSVYLQSGGGGGGRGGGGGGGRGGNTTPPKPFVDKVNIKTGEKMRLFEGENTGITETITTVIDPEQKKLVVMRQNATTPPQQFLFDNGNRKQLTNNEDLFPDLTRMVVQRFNVTRADGFEFRTVVYLPSDYKEGTRLPGFFWFYPYEYTSQEEFNNAANGGSSPAFSLTPPTNFPNFGSLTKQFLTRLGYAVIENQAPIVGASGQMNNNYVNDLRNDLAATIDELDRRQLIDRTRLAIGGHSYGAFSTVNALVNTPFFKAGIAGDGAYNRTLTPNGFQSERRDLWDAPNVYLDMSPFLRANQLSGALLMYHGMHDQNVGTDPINSVRLFHALNGLGKTVALYRYPFEDHGPAGRETLLDLWARWAAWLDKYVKNPQPPNKPAAATAPNRGGGGGR